MNGRKDVRYDFGHVQRQNKTRRPVEGIPFIRMARGSLLIHDDLFPCHWSPPIYRIILATKGALSCVALTVSTGSWSGFAKALSPMVARELDQPREHSWYRSCMTIVLMRKGSNGNATQAPSPHVSLYEGSKTRFKDEHKVPPCRLAEAGLMGLIGTDSPRYVAIMIRPTPVPSPSSSFSTPCLCSSMHHIAAQLYFRLCTSTRLSSAVDSVSKCSSLQSSVTSPDAAVC